MFLCRNELTAKKNRAAVGYDLGDTTSQISYCLLGAGEPETISVVAGEQQYNFPTVLSKRLSVNQWFYGREAVKCAGEKEGVLVENLLSLAREGEPVQIQEETFDPVALLALFMKRSLSLLNMEVPVERIEVLMFTVDNLDRRMVEVLTQAVAAMQVKIPYVFFQSHAESFYEYTIHQAEELWKHQVLVCDFEGDSMKTYCLEWNRRTIPVVAFIDEVEYPQMLREELPADQGRREKLMREWDRLFEQIAEEVCSGRILSSVYLIGRGFEGDWCRESLRVLCKGRRVFQGNNLYSKGACFGAIGKIGAGELEKDHVFLGREKLKANLGMHVQRRGHDSYLAIMDAGMNWYEAGRECELLLESGNSFSVMVTPLNGKDIKEVEVILNDLPERPPRTTRLRVGFSMKTERRVGIHIEDLGFGEIFPATHKVWEEEFEI